MRSPVEHVKLVYLEGQGESMKQVTNGKDKGRKGSFPEKGPQCKPKNTANLVMGTPKKLLILETPKSIY